MHPDPSGLGGRCRSLQRTLLLYNDGARSCPTSWPKTSRGFGFALVAGTAQDRAAIGMGNSPLGFVYLYSYVAVIAISPSLVPFEGTDRMLVDQVDGKLPLYHVSTLH